MHYAIAGVKAKIGTYCSVVVCVDGLGGVTAMAPALIGLKDLRREYEDAIKELIFTINTPHRN